MNTSSITYDALSPLNYTVYEDGTVPAAEAPDTYLTYFIVFEQPEGAANNRDRTLNSRVQVSMWSKDPALTQNALTTITAAMKAAGFLFINAGPQRFNAEIQRYGWRGDYRLYKGME